MLRVVLARCRRLLCDSAMEEPAEDQGGSFLQARCDQVLVTNDWCLPLVLALLLLLLVYTFLYLPSLAHHNNSL